MKAYSGAKHFARARSLQRVVAAILLGAEAYVSLGAASVTLPFDDKKYALAELKIEEARMNAYYDQLAARLDARSKTALARVQQAWTAYRQAQCDFAGRPTEGGSAQSLIVTRCFAQLTKARAEVLEAEMTCTEGDLTCEMSCSDADGACVQK